MDPQPEPRRISLAQFQAQQATCEQRGVCAQLPGCTLCANDPERAAPPLPVDDFYEGYSLTHIGIVAIVLIVVLAQVPSAWWRVVA